MRWLLGVAIAILGLAVIVYSVVLSQITVPPCFKFEYGGIICSHPSTSAAIDHSAVAFGAAIGAAGVALFSLHREEKAKRVRH